MQDTDTTIQPFQYYESEMESQQENKVVYVCVVVQLVMSNSL